MENIKFNISDFINDTEQKENEAKQLNENNEFPVNVFPPIFKQLIKESNESLNFPVDYTATAILTAVATAIGTSAKLRVKQNWFEYPALYTAIIGNAGANKSHPISKVFDVFNTIDKKAITEYEILYNQFDEYQKLTKKEKEQCTPILPPKLSKTILVDFSPEMLLQRLSTNQRGCTIVSDELATFLEGMNNYSKGDRTSTYLSLWSNMPASVDRVSKPIPLYVLEPFVSIIGGLQPRVLKKLFPTNKTDNGFLQRFLFAYPNNTQKHPINDNEMNVSTLNEYNQFIINYITKNPIHIDNETGNINSKIYYWSKDAKDFFYKWAKNNTIEVNKNANSVKGEIITKYDNHFVRLALILQIMECSDTNEISLKSVKGAEALTTYFMNNAFKVLDVLNEPLIPNEVLPANKLQYYDALPIEFTTEIAVKIGIDYDIKERTVKYFLTDKNYFEYLKYGYYKKKH